MKAQLALDWVLVLVSREEPRITLVVLLVSDRDCLFVTNVGFQFLSYGPPGLVPRGLHRLS